MNTTTKLVMAAMLLSTAACTAEATNEDAAASADQAVTSATTGGSVEMVISYTVEKELADALDPALTHFEGFGVGDVVLPGVLRLQHQYSIAALRLEVSSWALRTDLAEPELGSWGLDSSLGVTFPRWQLENTPEYAASHAAAKNLFNALTRAKVTTTSEHGSTETTRTTEHGSFACTKSSRAGRDEFSCTVAGIGQLGGSGLFWDWHTAEEKAQENAAKE